VYILCIAYRMHACKHAIADRETRWSSYSSAHYKQQASWWACARHGVNFTFYARLANGHVTRTHARTHARQSAKCELTDRSSRLYTDASPESLGTLCTRVYGPWTLSVKPRTRLYTVRQNKRNNFSFLWINLLIGPMLCDLTKFSTLIVNEYCHRCWLFNFWNLHLYAHHSMQKVWRRILLH